jgi:hypothetical protein
MSPAKIKLSTLKEGVVQLYLLSGLATLSAGGDLSQLRNYRKFRIETFAGKGGKVRLKDVVEFLNWCHLQRQLSK